MRPSISSAIDPLAVHRARMIDNTMIKVSPSSLTILMSSPSVLYGTKGKRIRQKTPIVNST